MKPKISTKVYCIYGDGILVDEVAFIGKDSFIIESIHRATYDDSWEWFYEDYGRLWFTDIDKAKQKLLAWYKEEYDDDFEIIKVSDNWYQVENDMY